MFSFLEPRITDRLGSAGERGQAVLEYGLVISVVAVALIIVLIAFKVSLDVFYDAIVGALALVG